MKRILAIILNYKTYQMTIDLIEQMKKLDESLFDVLVVDNGSPNESADILSDYSSKLGFLFIQNQKNAGYAAGNNIGIRYAIDHGYEFSLIINNDLKIVDARFMEKMVQICDADVQVACVGPKILDINGIPVPPYCERPTLHSLTLGIVQEKKKRSKYIDKPRTVYRVFGCCMLLRNSAMAAVDCMDERTFLYYEEHILTERLSAKEYTTFYNPKASIVHLESSTVNQEHSGKNLSKIKIKLHSMELYLSEYRHFNWIEIKLCQSARFLIMYLRG